MRLADQQGELSVAELIRLGLGVDRADDDVEVTAIAAEGWLGDLLAGRASERVAPVDVPPDFRGALRPYQARGLSWLDFLGRIGIGGVLADDMGLGKTVQLLALLAVDRHASCGGPSTVGPTLLVCPMSLVGNWEREAERLHPRGARARPPRCRTGPWRGLRGGGGEQRPGDHHVRHRHPRRGGAAADPVAPGGGRRGAGDQERGHQTGHRDPLDPRRGAHRGDRHPGREPAGGPVVDPGVANRVCSAAPRPSRSATPSRSSATATTWPRTGCGASRDRSCSVG